MTSSPISATTRIDGITQIKTPDGRVYDVSQTEFSMRGTALNVACTGTFCFTEDTPTETGELMIEKLKGDKISSINATGERFMATIKDVKRSITTRLTHLMIAGAMLNVTPAHPLQLSNGTWLPASQIQAGDALRTPTGSAIVEDACTEDVAPTPVVSFETENDAPYFVGNAQVLSAGTCDLTTIQSFLSEADYASFLTKLKGLSKAHETAILTALAKLDKPTLTAFLKDFSKLDDFAANPKLIEVWRRLDTSKDIRRDLTNLRNLESVVTSTTPTLTTAQIDEIYSLVNGSTSKKKLIESMKNLLPSTDAADYMQKIKTLVNTRLASAQNLTGACKKFMEGAAGNFNAALKSQILRLPLANKQALVQLYRQYPEFESVFNTLGKQIKDLKADDFQKLFANFQAHHIFPVNLINDNAKLREILEVADQLGWDFNTMDNLIFLSTKNHFGSHDKYTRILNDRINDFITKNGTTYASPAGVTELKKIISEANNAFKRHFFGKDLKINDYFEF